MVFDVEAATPWPTRSRKHPKAFTDLYVNMVAAGEAGGILDTILLRLADVHGEERRPGPQGEGRDDLPGGHHRVAVIAIIVLLIFVIPVFQNMFASVNLELPLPTRIVIGLSDFLKGYWWAAHRRRPSAPCFGIRRYYATPDGQLKHRHG